MEKFDGLRVILAARKRAEDARVLGTQLGAKFLLTCSVAGSAEAATVLTQLLDGEDGRLLWSDRVEVEPSEDQALAVETWTVRAAALVGDYAGLIARQLQVAGDVTTGGQRARVALYRYVTVGSEEALAAARAELSAVVADRPHDPELNAMFAFAVGSELVYRDDLDARTDSVLVETHAARALTADPRSAVAHLALSFLAIRRRDWETCAREARTAAELSPDHPSLLFSAGGALMNAGDWALGARLTRRSFDLNPFHPTYQHANLAFECLLKGDLAGALGEASIVDEGGRVWGPFCRAVALCGLGHPEQSRAEFREALRIEPGLSTEPERLFDGINLTADQLNTLLDLMAPLLADGGGDG
ncbi:hypothetical protein E8D34_04740 [Nocardioides sp. GY 10113]|uniref:hypothetical protein n=1 Tax=Nocardioides sp. GY 10113 TaxID=2569761 RepID=UPI0010A89829|nr:hypothetical protein [Nocardioides sp. GY 10113]TIC88250.1 hypothetical protein E8D34_04740 [Nocardioides sp. GY 10113]